MNPCTIPLDDYLKCLNIIENDQERHKKCTGLLIEYNNCVLGKGEWKERHKKFEQNKLNINLNAEKKHSLNDNSDKKIFVGEKNYFK